MKRISIIIITLIFLCVSGRSQAQEGMHFEANDPVVRYTVESGMMLHRYFKAYDVAIDTLRKVIGDKPLPEALGNGPQGAGWSFTWGEFEEPYVFIVKYGIVVDGEGKVTSFDIYEDRYVNETHHMLTARAYLAMKSKIEMSREAFGLEGLPIRIAVLPFPERELSIFVGPAQPKVGVSRFGADFMYNANRFTSQLTNMMRYHRTVMEIPLELPEGAEAALMVPDAPLFSPMDVAVAQERGTKVIVLAKSGTWVIYPDGKVGKLDPPRN